MLFVVCYANAATSASGEGIGDDELVDYQYVLVTAAAIDATAASPMTASFG